MSSASSSAQVIEIASVGTGMANMHAVRWLPGTARFFAAGVDARGVAVLRAYAFGGGGGEGEGEGEDGSSTATTATTDLTPRLTLDCTPTWPSGPQQGHPCAGLRCAAFFRVGAAGGGGGPCLLAASALDGAVLAFDPERPAKPAWAAAAAEGVGGGSTVSAIDALGAPGPPEIATGGLDGCVRVWDLRRRGSPVAAFEPPPPSSASSASAAAAAGPPPPPQPTKRRECWAVAFGGATSDSDRLLAAGYDNGDVKVFDLRMAGGAGGATGLASSSSSSSLPPVVPSSSSSSPPPPPVRWELNLGNGVCSLAFDRRDIEPNKLLAGCLEGVVAAVDLRGRGVRGGGAKAAAAAAGGARRPLVHRANVPVACGLAAELVAKRQRARARASAAARKKQQPDVAVAAAAAAVDGGGGEEDQRRQPPPPEQQQQAPQRRQRGGATIWAVAPLPQDRDVSACTTGDGAVVLHRYRYCSGDGDGDGDGDGGGGRLALAGGAALAPQPVGAFDWSPDKRGLFVCSALDQRLRVGVVTGLSSL